MFLCVFPKKKNLVKNKATCVKINGSLVKVAPFAMHRQATFASKLTPKTK